MGMHAESEVCLFLLHPSPLCAPVCIYSSMSSVHLSKPFRAFTLVLSEEEKSNPSECSV